MTERPLVLLSYRPAAEPLAAVSEVLNGEAEIVILPDHPQGSAGRTEILANARALMGWFPSAELSEDDVEALQGIGLIQLISAGADTVPLEAVPAGAVLAANVGGYAEPIAEHTIAMAMALAKRLPQKHAELAQGRFEQLPLNRWVAGSTCGILGFGGIGRAVARLMRALGTRIHAVNSSGRTDEPVDFCGTLADLDRVLEAADILVIALPLTPETDGLIGPREFGLMKPDAILVNVARGAIVDQAALYEHLRTHAEFTAGIDTWWVEPFVGGEFRVDFPFFELPNLLGSPHNSGFLPGVDVVAARRAAENVARWLRGERPNGIVLAPRA